MAEAPVPSERLARGKVGWSPSPKPLKEKDPRAETLLARASQTLANRPTPRRSRKTPEQKNHQSHE